MKLRRLAIVALVVAVALGAATPGFKVDKQLGSIGGILTTSEQRLDGAAAAQATVDTALGGLATTYADLITTVNGYVTDDGVHDELEIGRQQRLADYIASRATLKARSEAAVAFQAALTEYGPAAVKAKLAELDVAAAPRQGAVAMAAVKPSQWPKLSFNDLVTAKIAFLSGLNTAADIDRALDVAYDAEMERVRLMGAMGVDDK